MWPMQPAGSQPLVCGAICVSSQRARRLHGISHKRLLMESCLYPIMSVRLVGVAMRVLPQDNGLGSAVVVVWLVTAMLPVNGGTGVATSVSVKGGM